MNKPAGFFLRLLAYLNEKLIFLLLFVYLIYTISKNTTLSGLYYGLIVLLVIFVFVSLLGMVYNVLFTHYFGGNLGKLITGLRIKDQSGKKLKFKKVLFRQLLAYNFSWLAFGLGFLSILKDPNKQGFHDKTVDSNVFRVNMLWPLGLLIFLMLLGTNTYFLSLTAVDFSKNPVNQEIMSLVTAIQAQAKQEEKTVTQTATTSSSSASIKTTTTVKATTLNYSQEDVDSWKQEVEYKKSDQTNIKKYLGNSSLDQTKLQQFNSINNQLLAITERIYGKMSQKQFLTAADEADIKTYIKLDAEAQKLAQEIFQ
ncbi:MAG: RDD family protein [Microgenomates group bacterium]